MTRSPNPSPPIVALHGFTQTGRSWQPFVERLRQHLPDQRISTPDLPGHGEGGEARDLASAATDLAGRFGRSIWIGYSMGGRHLLRLAVDHPEAVAGMVLISATAGIESATDRSARRESDGRLADRIVDIGVDAFLDEWLAQPMFAGRLPAEDRSARADSIDGLAGSLRLAGAGTMDPLWDSLAGVTIPTLVIAGAEDTKFCDIARRLADTLADARLDIVDGAGHAVHLEQPDHVATVMADWLVALRPR